MQWTPREGVARRKRVGLGLTLAELSKVSSLSVASIRRIERGDATRVEAIDALAAALGVSRRALAVSARKAQPKVVRLAPPHDLDDEMTPPVAKLDAKPPKPPPHLTTLIGLEEAGPAYPPLRVGADLVPVLTVRAVRSLYTAFSQRAGHLYVAHGQIADHRGVGPEEAAGIDTRPGIGVRFYVARAIDERSAFGLTAHSVDPDVTLSLFDVSFTPSIVTLLVRVVVAPREQPVFWSFAPFKPQPWTLVIDRILEIDGKPAPVKLRVIDGGRSRLRAD